MRLRLVPTELYSVLVYIYMKGEQHKNEGDRIDGHKKATGVRKNKKPHVSPASLPDTRFIRFPENHEVSK